MLRSGVIATERFVVESLLGEGATSRVFAVRDRVHGGRFALKCLRGECLSPERVARFKDEFRAVERISHPNLAKVYELLADSLGVSLVMELVEGVDFLRFVRPGASSERQPTSNAEQTVSNIVPGSVGGALQIERVRAGLTQLVRGVRALHEAGKLHCDIKPENVLVTPEGRLVMVDFGLVTEAERIEHWRGTPAFMAPEQFDGVCAEAVDWYAVGMLLYVALCGRFAVTGTAGSELLARRLGPPVDPRIHAPDIPDDLAELAVRLLEPHPDRRPRGEDVERLLGIATRAPHARRLRFSFVGRSAELARLLEAFERTRRTGSTHVVHVHGDSGIGKTALASRFASEVEARGGLVFRGACYRDASVPYKALDSIMDRLGAMVRRIEAPIDRDEFAALATIFPVFGAHADRPTSGATRLGESSVAVRTRCVEALRNLLTRLAQRGGLVLCIDDLQWSDTDSVEVLAELLQPPPPGGILIVLGYRSSSETAGQRVQQLRRGLPPDDDLQLGPLDHDALRTIAKADAEVDPDELELLIRESRGNPFFMGELLRVRTRLRDGRPPSLDAAVAQRVDALPPDLRAYLEVVCVAGRPIEENVVRRAVAASHEQTLLARRALIASSFLRMAEDDGRVVEPYHDRIRECLLTKLEPERTRIWHEALALAYEAHESTDPEILAFHHRAARNSDKTLVYSERAGDAAMRALAFDHAADLYAAALEVAASHAAIALRLKYANALSSAGRPREAARAFRLALTRKPGNLDLLLRTGDEYLKAGQSNRGLLLLRIVARNLGEPMPQSRAMASARLLWNWLCTLYAPTCVVPEEQIPERAKRRLLVCLTLTRHLLWIDYVTAALFCMRHLRLARASGSRTDIVEALLRKAAFISAASPLLTGGVKRSKRLIAEAEAMLDGSDATVSMGVIRLTTRATVEFASGQWRSAGAIFDEALNLLLDSTAPRRHLDIAFCQCAVIEILRMEGDASEMRRRLRSFRGEARGHRTLEAAHALRGGVMLALCDDDPSSGLQIVESVLNDWPTRPQVPHYFAMVARVEIDLYCGSCAAALERALKARELMQKLGVHRNSYYFVSQIALEARAALAAGRLFRAARSIRILRRRREPWAQALGVALHGCLLARTDPARARGVLRHAAELAEACQLRLYGAAIKHRTSQELSAVGTRRAAPGQLHALGLRNPERMLASLLPLPPSTSRADLS